MHRPLLAHRTRFAIILTFILSASVSHAATWFADVDGDGFGDSSNAVISVTQPLGYVTNANDCNDQDAAVNPFSTEVCGNAVDEDCDTWLDDGCKVWFLGVDGDGHGVAAGW